MSDRVESDRIACLNIAIELLEIDKHIDCLDYVAYATQKLSAWVFSPPVGQEICYRRDASISCLKAALRKLVQQISSDASVAVSDNPIVKDHLDYVLNTAKAYAKFTELNDWMDDEVE